MKSVKEALLEIANRLPDDCTWEHVKYQIYVWRKIEEGVRAIERGDFVSHPGIRGRRISLIC